MSHGFQRSIKLSADATGRFMSEMTARRLSYVIQRKMNVHNYLNIMLLSILLWRLSVFLVESLILIARKAKHLKLIM